MSLFKVCMQCSMYSESSVVDDDVFTGTLFKAFPESSVVDDEVCTRTLFKAFLSWYSISVSATSNKCTWENVRKL